MLNCQKWPLRPAPLCGGGVWCNITWPELSQLLLNGVNVWINREFPASEDSLFWDTQLIVCDITAWSRALSGRCLQESCELYWEFFQTVMMSTEPIKFLTWRFVWAAAQLLPHLFAGHLNWTLGTFRWCELHNENHLSGSSLKFCPVWSENIPFVWYKVQTLWNFVKNGVWNVTFLLCLECFGLTVVSSEKVHLGTTTWYSDLVVVKARWSFGNLCEDYGVLGKIIRALNSLQKIWLFLMMLVWQGFWVRVQWAPFLRANSNFSPLKLRTKNFHWNSRRNGHIIHTSTSPRRKRDKHCEHSFTQTELVWRT